MAGEQAAELRPERARVLDTELGRERNGMQPGRGFQESGIGIGCGADSIPGRCRGDDTDQGGGPPPDRPSPGESENDRADLWAAHLHTGA